MDGRGIANGVNVKIPAAVWSSSHPLLETEVFSFYVLADLLGVTLFAPKIVAFSPTHSFNYALSGAKVS